MSTQQPLMKILAVAGLASASAVVFLDRRRRAQSDKSRIAPELLESPYAAELQLAVAMAKSAGTNMKGYLESKGTLYEDLYRLDEGIETKSGAADFCTKVDIENESMIMAKIQEVFPDHEIIGEETVGTGPIPKLTSTPTWIIDPIDGTTNFSQGMVLTCVSIGLCDGGKPVLGVIYAPGTEEWYLAVAGCGAFRNGQRITQRLTEKTLQTAVICAEFGYSRKQHEIDAMLGAVSRLLSNGCRGVRQLGSGVLDMCYVATGRLDIVYAGIVNEGWKPWDYCAGLVVCQETGCTVESIDPSSIGQRFDLYSKSIICGASNELVSACRKILQGS